MHEYIPTLINSISDKVNCSVKMWIDFSAWDVIDQDFHVLNATVNTVRYSTKTQQVCDSSHFKKGLVFSCFNITQPNPIINFVHNIYDQRERLDHLIFNINFKS